VLLVLAQTVAIWAEIRRYTTGVDVFVANLDNSVEWWWHMGPRPMLTVVITSLAFAALLGAVLWQVHSLRRAAPLGVVPTAAAASAPQVEVTAPREPAFTDQIDRAEPAGES